MKTITYDEAIYKLVPIEPTEAMIVDGFESAPDEFFSPPCAWAEYQAMSGCEKAAHRAELCYSAMLAAVPDTLPGVVEHSGESVACRYMDSGRWVVGHIADKEKAANYGCEFLFTHPPVQPAIIDGKTSGYITEVPEKSDRITWRGNYYHLPLNAAPAQPDTAALQARIAELEPFQSLFMAAAGEIADIHDAIGLDPDDAEGAEPIIEEIDSLFSRIKKLEAQLAAQSGQEPVEWAECERISDAPMVAEALENFSMDSTADNAICLVRSILACAPPAPANAIAIASAALEAAAKVCDHHAGGCSNYADQCAKEIRAIDKQTIIDAARGK